MNININYADTECTRWNLLRRISVFCWSFVSRLYGHSNGVCWSIPVWSSMIAYKNRSSSVRIPCKWSRYGPCLWTIVAGGFVSQNHSYDGQRQWMLVLNPQKWYSWWTCCHWQGYRWTQSRRSIERRSWNSEGMQQESRKRWKVSSPKLVGSW